MSEDSCCDSSVSRPKAVESLKILLDYAIAEGTALRLPMFVLLLQMANLELAKSGRREASPRPQARSVRGAEERVAPERVAPERISP